jgi:DNA-binding transcriptional regulator YiaG
VRIIYFFYHESAPLLLLSVYSKSTKDNLSKQQLNLLKQIIQKAFVQRYGFTLSAVRDWEQGRRTPERSARILLRVIEQAPSVVERA